MITRIELPTSEGSIDAALAAPETDGPWPGVVVLHDALGLGSDLERNVELLAAGGYLAIAPNLFSRGRVRCIPSVVGELLSNKRDGRAVRDIHAARDRLRADERCTGRVAVLGFCMGGGFALLVAPEGFDAAAPFYPSGRGNYAEILRGSCPVVASYGQLDPVNLGRGPELERVLTEYGIDHDVKTYPGAGHAFANRLAVEPVLRVTGLGYDEAATRDAWQRILEFFDVHLRSRG